jgi:hypothetical protein
MAMMPSFDAGRWGRDAASPIVAASAEAKRADFADWLFAKSDYYRHPDARPNLTALQNNITRKGKWGFSPSTSTPPHMPNRRSSTMV